MRTSNLVFRVWCLLIGGIFLVEILPGRNWLYDLIATFDSSRWVHFLVYTAVVAIPFAVWRSRRNVLLSLVPVFLTYALEYVQSCVYGPYVRHRNLSADLFGIAAGILLGLNLRAMRSSGTPLGNARSTSSSAAPVRFLSSADMDQGKSYWRS
jgi:putative effector of murein hydrolase